MSKLPADNPIREHENDLLGRNSVAKDFVAVLLALDYSEGAVVGVLGPWGSGKTSFINLARPYLIEENLVIVDFNPWMFSGAQELVESFFTEVSSQLRLNPSLAEVGKLIGEYGEVLSGLGWVPVVGTWLERTKLAVKLVSTGLKAKGGGTYAKRQKLRKALSKLEKPVVIVLDDIEDWLRRKFETYSNSFG